jgi:hypothetical protein
VTEYLVEAYQPSLNGAARGELMARARAAADAMTRDGVRIRYVRSLFVPGDEACFHVFEAGSAAAVDEASRRAGLPYTRIVEAVEGAIEPKEGGVDDVPQC